MLQQPTLSGKQGYGEQFDVEGLNFFRRLLAAIQNKEFVVYFQPKVSITDMRIAGAEALVRWYFNGQILPPVKFIPFCERTGLVIDIDFYVLEETCKKMREWLDKGFDVVRISVNFSKYHFNEAGVAERIYKVIKQYDIPPELIEVEFTETAYLDKEELLEYTVDKLKSYGIKSSIDDFGSGYSSLNLLQNMDFEVVKIDKSLLGKGVENEKAKKVISSIIHMAKELKMEVLAEGVETSEELRLLQDLKCDVVQGYFFDKPLPVDDFEARLKAGRYRPDGTLIEPARIPMKLPEVEEIDISKTANDPKTSSNRYLSYSETYPEKKYTGILVVGIIFLVLSLGILFVTFLWAGKDSKKNVASVESADVKTYTQDEVEKLLVEKIAETEGATRDEVNEEYLSKMHTAAECNNGMTNLLRTLFPDELVFMEGTRYKFVPIDRTLKMSTIETARFVTDEATGHMYYTDESGNKTSYFGIDVSSHQGKVDWNKVKNAGVDFAIIRCGFRGYGSEGRLVEDTSLRDNIVGATNAGLPTAYYFYSQAVTKEEAIEEADMMIKSLAPFKVSGPVILDVESASADERTKNLTPEERTDIMLAFLERVAASGYTPMIYSDLKFYTTKMDIGKLEDYSKWYANYNGIEMDENESIWSYNNPLMFPYEFDMWQYSNHGTIDGIKGEVDFNVLFEKWW